MIEINLIPDVKRELLRAQSTRAAVISLSIVASLIAVGAVVLLLVYVYGVQAFRSSELDGGIVRENQQLSQVEDLSKVLTIQNQLGKIDELNSQRSTNSRLFDLLRSVTPPAPNEVQFSQVTVNAAESTIRLEGETGNYESMETFKKTIDSAVFEYVADKSTGTATTDEGDTTATAAEQLSMKLANSISISDTSFGANARDEVVLRFTLVFTYPAELFSPDIDNVVFKLSTYGNVTDSYLGIPKSVFSEKAKDLENEEQ